MNDGAQRARQHLDQLRVEFETRGARLAALDAALPLASQQWREDAREERDRQIRHAEARRRWSLDALDRATDEAGIRARSVVARSVEELAPGCLGIPFLPRWTNPPNPQPGRCVRVGSFADPESDERIPLVLPLLGASGWLVKATDEEFAHLINDITMRLVYGLGPSNIRIHCYDPTFAVDLGRFAALRQLDRGTVPPAISSVEELEARLGLTVEAMSAVHEDLAAEGANTLMDAACSGPVGHAFRLLVLAGTPVGLSERGLERTRQIGRAGADAGVTVIAHGAAWGRVLGRQLQEVRIGDKCSADALARLSWHRDAPLETEAALHLARAAADRSWPSSQVERSLSDLVASIENPWIDPGDDGLEAAIGRTGKRDLVLRLRSADPPMPNAIIGGAVGQGKSNLLLALIHALAARYSPQDLQFVLLDLKDGVEFARLGPDASGRNWLPHARVLGLDFDLDYCLATLNWLLAETSLEPRSSAGQGSPRLATSANRPAWQCHALPSSSTSSIVYLRGMPTRLIRRPPCWKALPGLAGPMAFT